MPIPNFPSNLIARPFAAEGNFQIIPDAPANPGNGRASMQTGFPTETQLPLASGGVAPNRTDFNGILHLLSAFAFWQQSGGVAVYQPGLNYNSPAVVSHNGGLWWCVAANGPDSAAKVVEPGTDDNYWTTFLQAVVGGGSISFGTPVGTVITYHGTTAPDGYFACDGASFSASQYPLLRQVLGSAVLPDLRGYFVRGYDTRNTVDPDGASRSVGSSQTDAGRNVTGTFTALLQQNSDISASGAVYVSSTLSQSEDGARRYNYETPRYAIDAGRSWGAPHTAAEFRPANVCLLYCIKHD